MGASSSLPEIQSFDVEGAPAVAGEGIPRRCAPGHIVPTTSKLGPDIDNLYSMFARSAEKFASNECMGKRPVQADGTLGPFEWTSYKACMDKILTIGSGLAGLGIGKGDTYGIYAANSMEWACSGLGGWQVGATLVPVYDTLGDNIVQYEVSPRLARGA
jgi:long-chain acyl-CoA synthetase